MSEITALVTGGAGFIGRHLVRSLLLQGVRVRVLDLVDPGIGEAEFVRGSILDEDPLRKALAGINHVYHLAANPHLWTRDREEMDRLNVHGTELVLRLAGEAEAQRIVVTSTEAILAGRRRGTGERITEDTPLPRLADMPGPYSASKYRADRIAGEFAAKGLPVIRVYPTTPVGPGDHNLTPPTKMIRDFLRGKTPAYLDCSLNLVPVEEAAEGHLLAAERGRPGHRYILCNRDMLLSEILAALHEETGKKMPSIRIPAWTAYAAAWFSQTLAARGKTTAPIASVEGVRLARSGLTFDCRRTRKALGLQRRSVRAAIAASAHWLMENGHA